MSINSVTLVGNLTRDPELKPAGGTTVCSMRLAVNDRVKDQQTGEWGDRPNFFNVDAFGARGENCAKYLAKGAKITVHGRLRWREWETQEGQKREAVSIVADEVEFPSKKDAEQGGYQQPAPAAAPQQRDFNRSNFDPAEDPDFQQSSGDDDIPF